MNKETTVSLDTNARVMSTSSVETIVTVETMVIEETNVTVSHYSILTL